MAQAHVTYIYGKDESLTVKVYHHEAHPELNLTAFEVVQLGDLSISLTDAQLIDLASGLGDYLAQSLEEQREREVATTGEAGMAAAPDPVVHHDSDEERADYLASWREHQDAHS